MSRVVMDAVNIETGEAIYFNSHAKATYLSDGRNVESVLTKIDGIIDDVNVSAVEHVSVDDAETYVTNADLDKIINNIKNALDKIIGVDEEDTKGTFNISYDGNIVYTYQFENGMTWEEYLASDYCTGINANDFSIDDDTNDIIFESGGNAGPAGVEYILNDANGDPVNKNNQIENGTYYTGSVVNVPV